VSASCSQPAYCRLPERDGSAKDVSGGAHNDEHSALTTRPLPNLLWDLKSSVAGIVTFGELSVHGWDLARATQLPFEPDREGVGPLFELIQQTFGSGQDAPRGPAFAPAVPVPGDAPVFHQILGLLGRDPRWPEE
jgi:hypothetical protein